MYRLSALWTLLVVSLALPSALWAQTRANPDISVIGDMRYLYRDNVASGLAGTKETAFEFEEMELNFSAYLNPYARADVFIATHGVEGPVEVEEIYSTVLRALPVQLKFGKYFLDHGKLNTEHPHQWGWLERPLMNRTFFGTDGAAVTGLSVSRLQPAGETAVTLSLSAFRSDFFLHEHDHEAEENHEHADEEHGHGGDGETEIGYSGRLSAFRSLTETSHVEVGASYMYAEYNPQHGLAANVANVDVKYRWRPDTYRALVFRAEGMMSDREFENEQTETVESITAFGAFSSFEMQFRRRFDVGAFFDWTQDAADDEMSTTAFGAFFGFMPVEETARYSIVYRFEESDLFAGTSNTIAFQVLWSLGPHKPHKF
jgi:hypothetical protein